MKCITPTFSFDIYISIYICIYMDNYFTSFCLFIHLGVTNIGATEIFLCSTKILSLGTNTIKWQVHYHWEQAAAKRTWPLWRLHIKQKSSVTLNDSSAVYVACSESCEPKRFARHWSQIERNCIQEQQPNQFYCYK